MRIALVTDGIYPYVIGGMQKHSYYLAKYFALNKVHVELYHTLPYSKPGNEQEIFSEAEKEYIRLYFVPFPVLDKFPGHYLRESIAYSALIFEKMKTNPPVDFIYIQGLSGVKLLENRSVLKIKMGVHFHGLEMFQKAADFRSKLEQILFKSIVKKAMKRADVVFSLGGKLTDIILNRGVAAEKILTIPIGIDVSWIKDKKTEIQSVLKFVFVGRYERRKGIEELTQVLKRLLPEHSFQMDFIGPIPDKKKIQAPSVVYHGSITDASKISELISSCNVLICPSYSEGMPTVILEAMASGLAIIASETGAVTELVDKENGILIAPGNANELEKAMKRFLSMEKKELLGMKEHSIARVRQYFLWETVIKNTIEQIKRIVKE